MTAPTIPSHIIPPKDDGAGEPCPTPLTAADVVATFAEQSEPWSVDRDGRIVKGRTWGDGEPLYWLPGFATPLEHFALTAYLLRENFRCVLCELPSPNSGSSRQRMQTLVDDVIATADHHGDERFAMCGVSLGAAVALETTLQHRARVSACVLQGGFAHRRLSWTERVFAAIGRRMPGRLRHLPLWRTVQERNHRRWFPPFDTARWNFVESSTGTVSIRDLSHRAGCLPGWDIRPRLAEIETPALLIRGEGEGPIAVAEQEVLAANLPRVSEEPMHTTGQLPHITHPHRLAKAVERFLAERHQIAELDSK